MSQPQSRFLEKIGRVHDVVVMYLFGSRAADGLRILSGEKVADEGGSDLDVGVVLARPFDDPMLGFGGLHADLSELFSPLRVDLVLLDEAGAFIREAAILGTEIYCGDEHRRDLWELDALRRAGDLLPIQRHVERLLYGRTSR